MLRLVDVKARVTRLEELSRGLAKEKAIIREAEDPLLYLERRRYLGALDNAIHGVESARIALVKALGRLSEAKEAA